MLTWCGRWCSASSSYSSYGRYNTYGSSYGSAAEKVDMQIMTRHSEGTIEFVHRRKVLCDCGLVFGVIVPSSPSRGRTLLGVGPTML